MDEKRVYYHVQIPVVGWPQEFFTVARAATPAGAAEVVRALLENMATEHATIRVEVRVEL
jgi:hypothetical protein